MRPRGLSFGSVAQSYERYRPGYPDELVDLVLRYAGCPVRNALEVGAGTGKATRLFAARGIDVTALEPDAGMAQVLARVLAQVRAETAHALPVRTVLATFEAFDSGLRFDLVFAAASWHWTDPATRWARAVDVLVPGGVLALFGRPVALRDPELSAAVDAIEQRLLAADDPSAAHSSTVEQMTAADGLADVVARELPAHDTTTAEDFVHRLATVSAYLALEPQRRAQALHAVRAVLPDVVDVDTTVGVLLARRAG